jgi:hypothetical protein
LHGVDAHFFRRFSEPLLVMYVVVIATEPSHFERFRVVVVVALSRLDAANLAREPLDLPALDICVQVRPRIRLQAFVVTEFAVFLAVHAGVRRHACPAPALSLAIVHAAAFRAFHVVTVNAGSATWLAFL